MAQNDYMTLTEFRTIFPEFRTVSDEVVEFYLVAAAPFTKPSVFQNQLKAGHGYKAAAMLADSPYARTIKQEGDESNYDKRFADILNAVAPRAAVLNGPPGWGC